MVAQDHVTCIERFAEILFQVMDSLRVGEWDLVYISYIMGL